VLRVDVYVAYLATSDVGQTFVINGAAEMVMLAAVVHVNIYGN